MIKLLNLLVIVFFTILKVLQVHAQVLPEWTDRYNPGAAKLIIADEVGNIYLCGTSNGDYVTIKYNPSGMKLWSAIYNGTGNGSNVSSALSIDVSGNIYVTGESKGNGTGADYTTLKYNPNGVQKWIMRYTTLGNRRDAAYAMTIDNQNNIYVTGESANDIGGIDCLTIKYDSLGNQLWVAKYNQGKNSSNQGFAITHDNYENVFITSRSDGDIVTIKYDSFGVQLWAERFNGPLNGEDAPFSMALDSSANVYICGITEGDMHYDDYVIIKYNSDGMKQWTRIYNGTANYLDRAGDLAIDKTGNIYVTGYATQTGSGYDFTTIKYNGNGDQLWLVKYNNGLNDIEKAISLDDAGNIYVTGESDGNGTGFDYATIKYDSNGVQKWVIRYSSTGDTDDVSNAIAIDNSGSVFVTGYSGRNILTIKYSQLTGTNTPSSELPSEFRLEQNYPNPFNPSTAINYSLSVNSFVNLEVYDVLGNEIAVLVNEKQNRGSYNYQFSNVNYQMSSGVYFYKLTVDGNLIDTKRMLLLK